MPGRAEFLKRNRDSVRAQSFTEWEQLILKDETGAGIAAAQRRMWTVEPRGAYVLVLDDDDQMYDGDVLNIAHKFLEWEEYPPFMVCKVKRMGEDFPLVWNARPTMGTITVSNVLVRRDVWMKTRTAFGEHYAGDFDWIDTLFEKYGDAGGWLAEYIVNIDHVGAGVLA